MKEFLKASENTGCLLDDFMGPLILPKINEVQIRGKRGYIYIVQLFLYSKQPPDWGLKTANMC